MSRSLCLIACNGRASNSDFSVLSYNQFKNEIVVQCQLQDGSDPAPGSELCIVPRHVLDVVESTRDTAFIDVMNVQGCPLVAGAASRTTLTQSLMQCVH